MKCPFERWCGAVEDEARDWLGVSRLKPINFDWPDRWLAGQTPQYAGFILAYMLLI